ncbi:excisionase family DNA-binding protein [Amycolatopsis sp. RM579]|uniref:Excisionase family DNA-binding protein n=1 Tax=Amycolatopsis pithecellobii TaxID=664692 RepID=A0A6N7Z8K0_9PSEU|nr:helix-turn-helix domain-containing protein [Amycolatopsis pithecellobii]MTD56876.1 excisionase family DNA-binding protein [Amycolatopsis pithecellobii]
MKTYVGVEEAAALLKTSVRFVRRLIAERRITFYRVGRHVRLAVEDLESFVEAGKVEPIVRSGRRNGLERFV